LRSRTVDIDRIGRNTLILTGVVSALSAWVWGPAAALSAAAGGGLATGNLHLIRATVSRLIARTGKTAQGVGLVVLKLGLMVVLVAGAFHRFPVEPVAFAAGLSMLLVALLLDACVLGAPLAEQ
jgi:hypothetical protein